MAQRALRLLPSIASVALATGRLSLASRQCGNPGMCLSVAGVDHRYCLGISGSRSRVPGGNPYFQFFLSSSNRSEVLASRIPTIGSLYSVSGNLAHRQPFVSPGPAASPPGAVPSAGFGASVRRQPSHPPDRRSGTVLQLVRKLAEFVLLQVHSPDLLIRDLSASRVFPAIQTAGYLEPFGGRRPRDQIDDRLSRGAARPGLYTAVQRGCGAVRSSSSLNAFYRTSLDHSTYSAIMEE